MALCMARAASISSGRKISPVAKRSPTSRMPALSRSTSAVDFGALLERRAGQVAGLRGVSVLYRQDELVKRTHRTTPLLLSASKAPSCPSYGFLQSAGDVSFSVEGQVGPRYPPLNPQSRLTY